MQLYIKVPGYDRLRTPVLRVLILSPLETLVNAYAVACNFFLVWIFCIFVTD